jgi:hypothetical protein
MANSNGWGDGAANNTIGWGQGANNTIGWGSVYAVSNAGLTDIIGAAATAPVNTTAPEVSGALYVGESLTTTDGTWTGTPTSYTYQWKRGATNIGTNSNTYTLVIADASLSISCVVTAINAIGSTNATSNTLEPYPLFAPFLNSSPYIGYSPIYTGDTAEIITEANFGGNEPPTVVYQWYSNDILQIGQTGLTYTTTILDQGFNIAVIATGTNSQGTDFGFSNQVEVQTP